MFSFVLGQVLKIVIFLLSCSTESQKWWVARKSLVIFWSNLCGPSRVSRSQLQRNTCSQVLNGSWDGDFTVSLRNVLHCSQSKKVFFLCFWGIPCCLVHAHWLLACHWLLLTESGSVFFTPCSIRDLSTLVGPSWVFPSQGAVPASPGAYGRCSQSFDHPCGMCDHKWGRVITRNCESRQRHLEAHPCTSLPMRSLELVPGWCDWQPSSSVCPLALDAAEGTESLENLYVWSSKSPYRYILMCSLVSGT